MNAKDKLESGHARLPAPQRDEARPPDPARWRQRTAALGVTSPHEPSGPASWGTPGHERPEDGGFLERAPRDAELWQLARRGQGTVLRLDFELRTAIVRQLFRRDFVYVSRQLHGLEASRRVQGLDRERLEGALAALVQRANEVRTLLGRIAAQLDATIAAAGQRDACLAPARVLRFQATIVSPSARGYLELLRQADDTLARGDIAWLLGLVAAPERAALASDVRRTLHGFKELASQRRQDVGEHVRAVNACRRTGGSLEALAGGDP